MKVHSDAVMVFLGVGSNLGDRFHNIIGAIERLGAHPEITVQKVSSIIEAKPEGNLKQPDFLNGVVKVTTTLQPLSLLAVIQEIDHALGRMRNVRFGPRTIDLDILLYGDVSCNEPRLIIPHPRMKERDFVMKPLREIEPGIDTMLSQLILTQHL